MNVAETSIYLYLRLKSVTGPYWVLLCVAMLVASFTPLGKLENWDALQTNASTSAVAQTAQATSNILLRLQKPVKPDYTIPPVTDGLAPVIASLPTRQPVVFLGIDDGLYKDSKQLKIMQARHIKATLFLDNDAIKDNPSFFKAFTAAGSRIEDHTLSHSLLTDLSYDQQREEICGQADMEAKAYGRRPILFRPPYGEYNTDTQRAVADCGMKAVVTWVAKANGGSMQYQTDGKLHPGDIVLMHFRPEFLSDMDAFIQAQNAAGLHTELLEDWLPKD